MSKSVIWNCLRYRPIWKEGYIYSQGLTIWRVYYVAGETTICLICSRVSHWIVWGAKPHLDKGMSISMVWHDEEWNDHLFDVQECHMRRSTIIGAATGESITREIWDNFVLRLLLMKNPVTSLRRTALDFFLSIEQILQKLFTHYHLEYYLKILINLKTTYIGNKFFNVLKVFLHTEALQV